MDDIKRSFEEQAVVFDELIIKLIPCYRDIINTISGVLNFKESEAIRVLDIGTGTGNLAGLIKERYPNCIVDCVDLAENMLKIAESRHGIDNISYKCIDFNDIDFSTGYDAVVSSLTLHHIQTDNERKKYYKKIYEGLNEGGIFVNGDIVLGSSQYFQDYNMQGWKDYMTEHISEEEAEDKWIAKYKRESRPSKLKDQLEWMDEIGFSDVDVFFKLFNYSVFGGVKRKA